MTTPTPTPPGLEELRADLSEIADHYEGEAQGWRSHGESFEEVARYYEGRASTVRKALSLLDRLSQAEAERDDLKHDIDLYVAANAEVATELEATKADRDALSERVKALEGALETVREVFSTAVIDQGGAKISLYSLQRIDTALLQKDPSHG